MFWMHSWLARYIHLSILGAEVRTGCFGKLKYKLEQRFRSSNLEYSFLQISKLGLGQKPDRSNTDFSLDLSPTLSRSIQADHAVTNRKCESALVAKGKER